MTLLQSHMREGRDKAPHLGRIAMRTRCARGVHLLLLARIAVSLSITAAALTSARIMRGAAVCRGITELTIALRPRLNHCLLSTSPPPPPSKWRLPPGLKNISRDLVMTVGNGTHRRRHRRPAVPSWYMSRRKRAKQCQPP